MTEDNKPFEFDEQIHEVSFPATTKKGDTKIVSHRLRRPTLEELHKRESLLVYETKKLTSRATSLYTEQDPADIWLWNQVIMAVKGYQDSDSWQELGDEEKEKFNSTAKTDAINLLYATRSVIEGEGDYVPIGPTDWTIRQEIGPNKEPDFVVYHVLREPTEEERLRYDRAKSTTIYIAGARRETGQVQTHLKPNVELYDALIQEIKGGTVGGETFPGASRRDFLLAIDPMWKRNVIQALMLSFEAQISD